MRRFILTTAFALFLPTVVKSAVLVWDNSTSTAGAQDGSGTWNAGSTNFWNGTANVTLLPTDTAQFGAGGTLASPGTVSVATQSIGGLVFGATTTNGYVLNGAAANSVLSLGSGGILLLSGAQETTVGATNLALALTAAQAFTNQSASNFTIGSNIANNGFKLTVGTSFGGTTRINGALSGTGGLTKTGNGTLVLSGVNTYGGETVINGGSVVVTNQNQLGDAANISTISINGIAATGGFNGGQLVVDGGLTGTTFTREISILGRGPGTVNSSGGLVSVGNNTFNGDILSAGPASGGRIVSAYGTTTLNGQLTLGSGADTVIYGSGNTVVNGQIVGYETINDRFIKSGNTVGSTLLLNNENNSFLQSVRFDSGTVRVASVGALGQNTTAQSLDFNNGTLEIRTDSTNFSTKSIFVRDNVTGSLFVDRAVDGSGVGKTLVFNELRAASANNTFNFGGRDGYGAVFKGAGGTIGVGGANNATINNNSSGLLKLDANLWGQTNTTARTLTIGGNGETQVTGSILATGAAHTLTKNGSGTLYLQGTASTYSGATSITNGTIVASSINSLGSGAINLGNATTTAGALTLLNSADETLSRAILLNTTTANAYLNASGTGKLTVNGAITAVAGAKTFVLGGTSTAANEIASAIPDSTTLALQKIGSGTWVLSGANLYTGATTVSGGLLQVKDTFSGGSRNVIANGSAVNFNVDLFTQAAAGTFEYLGADGQTSAETVGALTPTAGAGTVRVTPGTGGSATLTFSSLGTVGAGTGINFTGAGSTVLTGATNLNGILNAHLYYNGADFAAGSTVGAASYTEANSSLAGTNTLPYLITGDFTQATSATVSAGLKFGSSRTLTLDTGVQLTVNNGANTVSGGILVAGGSTVTITGGTGITTGGAADLVFRTDTAADTLNLGTVVSGTGGFTKNGAGKLVVSGLNTVTGTVALNEGTIQLSGVGRLGVNNPTGTALNLVVRQGATFDLNGVNATSGSSIGLLNGAGTITNSAAFGNATIELNTASGTGTGYFTGLIQDGANATTSLRKGGSFTLSLTGQNTFTGPVTLNGGILAVTSIGNIGDASALGKGNSLENASSLVFNGGTLQYVGANGTISQTTQTPSISTNREFTLDIGGGTIDSSGSYGSAGLSRTRNDAALIFSSTNDITLINAGARNVTLTGDSLGDNEIALRLKDVPVSEGGGKLGVIKASSGLWILSNKNNDYTGNTEVRQGTLRVGDDGSATTRTLPTGSALVLGNNTTSGVLETSGVFTRNVATAATAGSVFWGGTTGGGGFAASNAPLIVALGGQSTPTALKWASGGFVPNGASLFLNSSTALFDVNFVNNIDLNGAVRTVQVDDNGSTNLDYATLSGVLSNSSGTASGLIKTGGGTLILNNANSYDGPTTLSQGNLIVSSIGAAGVTTSSFGTNTGANAGVLNIGNGTNNVALVYVGSGETTTRTINLVAAGAAPGSATIDSSGSGALVLTSVVNSGVVTSGNKTFQLRGTNTDANRITASFGDGGTALNITKADGGVWVLDPATSNSFTGVINANGGLLGLTANGIGTASGITFNNGGIFAYGGALTTNKPITVTTNTTAVFGGQNNITINANVSKQAGNTDITISNSLENGAVLTVNGNFVNLEAPTAVATRTANIRGFGSTIWNGVIADEATAKSLTKLDIRLANDAFWRMDGSSANTYTGGTFLGQGTLILNKVGALGGAAGLFQFVGGVLQAGLDLTGASNKLANQVALQGDPVTVNGSNSIEFGAGITMNGSRSLINDLVAGKQLIISGGVTNSASNTLNIFGSGETLINSAISATNTQSLTYSGTGKLSLTASNPMTGTLTANRGLIELSGSGAFTGTANLTLNSGGTLRLNNSGGEAVRIGGRNVIINGGTLDFIGDANGTNETAGTLTVNGVTGFITMSGGASGTNKLTFSSVSFANTGSSLDLSTIANLGTSNLITFTTAPTGNALINSVMPRVFIGGNFATYDNTLGIKALTTYSANPLNAAGATDTLQITADGQTLTGNRTVNAIKLSGNGLTFGSANGYTLTLSAATILNTGGNNTWAFTNTNFGGNVGYVQVDAGSSLNVTGALNTASGFAKVGGGDLTLTGTLYSSSTNNILEGTVKLNGGLNTIYPTVQNLNINKGATLDLNGNSQYTGPLTSSMAVPGGSGVVTNTGALATIVSNTSNGSSSFGQITGTLNFARLGGNTITFEDALTYTGATVLMSGTTTLQDDATLLNTSSIDLNYGTLSLNNNSNLQTGNNNRIGDNIPITLRGGTIVMNGRVDYASAETFGALTLDSGTNTISANNGGTGSGGSYASTDLTFASLTRLPGSVVNFTGSNLGAPGNNSRIAFAAPVQTVGRGLLGAWAVANFGDYAAYNNTNGVGIVGAGGFAGYDATFGSNNITNIGADAVATGVIPAADFRVLTNLTSNTSTGMLRLAGGYQNDITFGSNSTVLNLELGGLLKSNDAGFTTIGTPTTRGVITAGGTATSGNTELVVYNNQAPTYTGIGTNSTISGQNTLTLTAVRPIQVGSIVTGNGIQAGTTVLAVNGAVITLSQNATATNNGGNFNFATTTTINSVIANSGTGTSTVSLTKAGGGTLILTAPNTYSGGTIVSQGTVLLQGDENVVVIPGGGLTLSSANMTMVTNGGQINANNDVTLNGSSILTLVGNNTLKSITFNNTGGTGNPAVNVGTGTLTLTSSTPISLTSTNALTTPAISGGTLALGSGAKTINIGGPSIAGQLYSSINVGLNISSIITGAGASITKTGNGNLQLSAQNTFDGDFNLTAGGIIFGANSTLLNTGSTPVLSGPVGTGTLNVASGAQLLVDNASRTINNPTVFAGMPVFDNTGLNAATLTMQGKLTLPNGALNVRVVQVGLTAALAGEIPNIGSITSITKTGLGNLSINLNGYNGPITMADGGTLGVLLDGDGTAVPNQIDYTGAVNLTGVPNLLVGRAGGNTYYAQAANKVIRLTNLTNAATILKDGAVVTANNGYGLLIDTDIALNSGANFNVINASASNLTQGLTLSGLISGGATTGVTWTKSGSGTLVLTNNSNSFGGSSSFIDITGGYLSVNNDAQLGAAGNGVRISTNSTSAGFRATGNITTGRVFTLNAGNSTIEVAAGAELNLTSAFALSAVTNNLVKADRGTLTLSANNPTWTGGVTVSQGVLKIANSGALGTSAGGVTISQLMGQVQLSGGVTIADTLTINAGDNQTFAGIDATGALRSVDGNNTWSGLITLPTAGSTDTRNRSALITVDSGSQLTLSGGLTASVPTSGANRNYWFALGGEGTGFITTNAISFSGGAANNFYQLGKVGTGTWNLQVANGFTGHQAYINEGKLSLNGAGSFATPGTGGAAASNTVFITQRGTLELDNSSQNVDNRLGGTGSRNLEFRGGNLTIIGNSASNTTEALASASTLTFNAGRAVITLSANAASQLNFTTGAATRGAGGTLLVRGSGLGNAAANGVATIQGQGNGFAFIGQTGATGTNNKGIIPWALGDTSLSGGGIGFLTADSAAAGANTGTNRLRFLTASEQVTNALTGNANVVLSGAGGALSAGGNTTINSLVLGSGGGLTISPLAIVTIDSGGLIAQSGNTGISGGSITTTSNRELIIHTLGDLDISSAIVRSSGGLSKSGAGTLTLSSQNNYYTGTTYVNEGVLKLNGGTNTIFYNQALVVQGGAFDLNGNVQVINNLQNSAATNYQANLLPDAGGIVKNSSATQAVLGITTNNASWGGQIQDNIALVKSQSNGFFQDWNIYSDNSFSGPLLLNGGRIQMLGTAAFSGTTAIDISGGTLILANNNATSLLDENVNDRINDLAAISLRGGMIQTRGRFGEISSETFGALTLLEGNSFIDVANAGTGLNETTATFASLTNQSGAHGTLRFMNVSGQYGSNTQVFFTSAPTVTNNIIGGWAVSEREFASYTGMGVGSLNSVGYAGYASNTINTGLSTDNIRISTGGTTTLTSDKNIYSLAMVVGAATTLDLGGKTLTLGSGGLIASQGADNAAINIQNGSLTSGISDLYLHALGYTNGNTNAINRDVNVSANIVNNGANPVALVIAGDDGRGTGQGGVLGAQATTLSGNNTYSGGTFINGGRVILNTPGADGVNKTATGSGNVTITGGAATNGSTVYERTSTLQLGSSDQIKNTATVTLNGGGILDLNYNSQTVAGLNFNNTGGYAPTVSFGTGVLTLNGNIVATGSNLGSVSTLGGTILGISTTNGSNTATVGSTAGLAVGMSISGPQFNGTISAINADGVTITLSGNANATVVAPYIVNSLPGTVDLGGATRTIQVDPVTAYGKELAPLLANLNITAVVQGAAGNGIVKTGNGLLQLSAQNTFSGNVAVQAGGIILGANSTPTAGGTTILSGPLGTGSVSMASGTRLLVDNASRTVGNNFTFAGNPIFESTGTGTSTLTLNGSITLPNGAVTISVQNPLLTASLLGRITNAASITTLTKVGLGNLIFNTDGYTGPIVFQGTGTLSLLADGNGLGDVETLARGGITFDAGVVPVVTIGRAAGSLPFIAAQNKILAPSSFSSISGGITVTNNNGYQLLLVDNATLNSGAAINVVNASASNVLAGLVLNGNLSGTNGISKTGNGTLQLGGNNSGLSGTITVSGGAIAISADNQLGAAANAVTLNGTTATLRATGTFSSGRTINLNNGTAANNVIEVTGGSVLTLTGTNSLVNTTGFVKANNGVLEISGSQNFAGTVTINAGAVRVSNASALGTTAGNTAVTAAGAALQLSGGVTLAEPLSLTGTGINTGGALQALAGTAATQSGAITLTGATTIGADLNATLNITGGITGAQDLTLGGFGAINIGGSGVGAVNTLTKIGTGTTTISVGSTSFVGNLTTQAGTLVLSGAGKIGGTGTVTGNSGSTIVLDNSGTVTAARLSGRAITLNGTKLTLIGNDTTAGVEALGGVTFNRGSSVVTVIAGAAGAGITFGVPNNPGVSQASAPTGATVLFRGNNLGSTAGAGVATIASTTTGFTFVGATGGVGTTTKGILPWALVDTTETGLGTSFATADTATGLIRPLSGSEMVVDTLASGTNVLLTGSPAPTNTVSLNSLTLQGTSFITLNNPVNGVVQNLQLSSGGLLVRDGAIAGITGGVLQALPGLAPLVIHTVGNSTLVLGSTLLGGNSQTNGNVSFVKSGAGNLILSPTNSVLGAGYSGNLFTGQLTINDGTVTLSGGNNTISYNNYVNLEPGATLDLNGTSQFTFALFTNAGGVANAGGTVRGIDPTSTLVMNHDNATRNFAGNFTGGMSLQRAGQGTWNLYSVSDFTGATLVTGGTTNLRDEARFTGTSSVDINYSTLQLDNTGTIDLGDRLNDAAPIKLRGGVLNLLGRAQTDTTETAGALTVLEGNNTVSAVQSNTGINSVQLTLASLTRLPGATLNFGAAGQMGSSARVLFTTAPTLTSNFVLGPWAIANANDFATYNNQFGIGGVGNAGFRGYDSVMASGNITNLGATTNFASPITTTGMLRLSLGGTLDLTFSAANNVLQLEQGGLLRSNNNNSTTIGTPAIRGVLTAGTAASTGNTELIVYNNQGTTTINSIIKDTKSAGIGNNNANATVSLIKSGGGTLQLTGANTYSGGTIVNQGTLQLNGAAGTTVIPAGGLTISGATVSWLSSATFPLTAANNNNNAGLIDPSNVVTLNGSGTLILTGDATLAGLVFHNNGGSATAPTVHSSSTSNPFAPYGTLTLNGNITADATNGGSVATVAGRLNLGSANRTIDVGLLSFNGQDVAPLQATLQIHSITGTSGFTKTGAGALQLNGQNDYTGPTVVSNGTLIAGFDLAGARFSDLTLAAGTKLNLNSVGSLWGSLSGSGTVFNPALAVGNNNGNALVRSSTLTVGYNGNDATFSGQFSRYSDSMANSVNVVKLGSGNWTLTGSADSTFGSTGTLTVQGGTVTYDGTGTAALPNQTIVTGGKLVLDNSVTNQNDRLVSPVAPGVVNISGGELVFKGNASVATTDTLTTLTVGSGAGVFTLQGGAGQTVDKLKLTVATLSGVNTGGTLLLRGTSTGQLVVNTPNFPGGQNGTPANGTTTMPIRPDIIGLAAVNDPTSATAFVTRDTTSLALRPLTAAEMATALTGAGSSTTNYTLSVDPAAFTANQAVNTLRLENGISLVGNPVGQTSQFSAAGTLLAETITTGGVLALAGDSTFTFGQLATTNNTAYYFHLLGSSSLTLNTILAGTTGGLVKSGTGTLTLNKLNYYTGTTTVNEGVLKLAGGNNTLVVTPTATTPSANTLAVNGGTFDLNGNSQVVGALVNNNPLANTGGTVTNSAGGAPVTLTTINNGTTFGGNISGNLNLDKVGNATLTLSSPNTYTGETIIRGSSLTLRDSGTLSNTSKITSNFATLTIDQSGINPNGNSDPVRIPASTPITLNGGAITFVGNTGVDSQLTIDSLTIAGGGTTVNTQPLINRGNTATVTIGNLIRDVNNKSTFNGVGFVGTSSLILTNTGTLGGIGLNANGRIFINKINGTAFSQTSLVNNLIGGWAIADGSTFATYSDTLGIGGMGSTGFPNFDGTDVRTTTATQNINDGTAARAITSDQSAYTWRLSAGSTQTVTLGALGAPVKVTLGLGLITNVNVGVNINSVDPQSQITGPAGSDFVVFVNQNTTSINTRITGDIALIKTGGATLSLNPSIAGAASNSYTGGTFVQGGTLTLAGGAGSIVIPGDLTLNNANVSWASGNTNAGQIAATSKVTINGGGALTMTGTNTLDRVTFNNSGGYTNGNPTLNAATLLRLTSNTAITAVNDNYGSTPTISGTAIVFDGNAPVINTSGLSLNSLNITAVIQTGGGALTKTGSGALMLSGANTFNNGFNLNEGTLIVNSAAAAGTGTLTLADGTSLFSGTAAQTLTNPVTINGNITLGGTQSTNSINLNGAIALGSGQRGINIPSSMVTDTLGGAVTGATGSGITKTGNGTLVLSSTGNSWTGPTRIEGGVVRSGAANVLPDASAVIIGAGAVLNLNNFDETIGSLAGGGMVTNSGANARTLTVGADGTDATFSGIITASAVANLALTKTGIGKQTLTGANSYAGVTNVNGGTLSIGHSSALGATTAGTTVANNAALELQGNITVGTETLSLTGTGVSGTGALRNLSGNNIYGGAITLTGATSIVSDAGLLSLNVPTGSAISGAFGLTFGGAGDIAVLDPIATGVGTLTKTGTGTLTLGAANTNTGTTQIVGGTIKIATSEVLANTSDLVIEAGGAFDLSGNSETVASLSGAGIIRNTGAGLSQLTFGSSGTDTTYSGQIVDNVALVKTGLGTLTLSNATSTFSGGVTISSGKLVIAASSDSAPLTRGPLGVGTLTIAGGVTIQGQATSVANAITVNGDFTVGGSSSSDDLTLNGPVALGGASRTITVNSGVTTTLGGNITTATAGVDLNKNGAGTLVLSGTGNSWTGATKINGGTVRLGASGVIPDSSVVTASNGTTLDLSGQTETIGGLLGDGSVTNTHATNAATLTVNNTADSAFTGLISNGAAALNVEKSGSGTLTVSGANTYTGTTTVNGGILRVTGNTALGATAGGTIVNSGGTLELDGSSSNLTIGAEALTLAGTGSASNGALRSSAGANSIQGSVTLGGNATIEVAAGSLSLPGTIGDGAGSFALTKSGGGTLTLGGTNTYKGGTILTGGTLAVSNDSALGDAAGSVTFNGASTLAISGDTTSTRSVVVNAAGTVDIATGKTVNLNGQISGTGSFTKAGAGTVVFGSAGNSYSGGTTISGGTLSVSSDAQLGSATGGVTFNGTNVTLAATDTFATASGRGFGFTSAGTIDVAAAKTLTVAGALSGTGSFTKAGSGALLLNGDSSAYTAAVNVNAGTLGGSGKVGGRVTVASDAALSPGESIGTFTAGALTLSSGAQLKIEVDLAQPNLLGGVDRIDLTSIAAGVKLDLGSNSVLSLTGVGSNGSLQIGDHWSFITYQTGGGNVNGTFTVPGFGAIADYEAGQENPSYFFLGGTAVGIDYNYQDANFPGVSSVALVVVPEPGSLAALAAASGLLLGLGRFRRRVAR